MTQDLASGRGRLPSRLEKPVPAVTFWTVKAETIRQTLFGTPWKTCRMALSSGEALAIEHPNWVFISPGGTFLIVVLPDESHRVIEPDHVVSLEVEPPGRRPRAKAQTA